VEDLYHPLNLNLRFGICFIDANQNTLGVKKVQGQSKAAV